VKIRDIMAMAPVIPVLTIDDESYAVPLARALVAGGIPVLEVTLRTPCALSAVAAIAKNVEGAIVGVGTVTRADEFRQARRAGACFAVSPGLTPALIDAARASDLPFLPGVMTPSEAIAARAAGYSELKLFPAQQAGGIGMLKALAAPFPDLAFCPTGGITLETAPGYMALVNVVCVGGSWVAPKAALAAGDWQTVTELARQAVHALKKK
jgi:2-dehydro-3-deoxyphosphogluconate aldolase/(4S)-4-hydroxy-2-oxoglutarate aldolase